MSPRVNSTREVIGAVTFDKGDVAVSILSSILLWILVPGCAFVYSGGGRRRSALTTLMVSFWGISIVFIQWWAIGYSLVFSRTGGPFIGNFDKVFLMGVYDQPGTKPATSIPELALCLYQGVTATLGPAFIFGILADRGRILPALVFTLIWTTLVYDFVAYWSLNPNGWASKLGVLDFGGGMPVHVPVAGAGLAYTIILGPTMERQKGQNLKPHNMSSVVLGTTLIWIGSFGYNAGSAYRSNMVAIMACVTTNLAASSSAIVWATFDYCREGNFSAFGFCMGAIVGLVSIVPASGYISPSAGVAIGAISCAVCYLAYIFKDRFFFDDVMDVVIVNGIGGVMGNILTGIFTQKFYAEDEVGDGGWLEGHWMQVPYQLADSAATFGLSFVVSFVTLFGMNQTKCLKLRATKEDESSGIDEKEVGMNCYEFIDEILKQEPPPSMQEKPGKLITISNGIGRIEHNDSNIHNNSNPPRNNWLIN